MKNFEKMIGLLEGVDREPTAAQKHKAKIDVLKKLGYKVTERENTPRES